MAPSKDQSDAQAGAADHGIWDHVSFQAIPDMARSYATDDFGSRLMTHLGHRTPSLMARV
jgi:hypothetical protein